MTTVTISHSHAGDKTPETQRGLVWPGCLAARLPLTCAAPWILSISYAARDGIFPCSDWRWPEGQPSIPHGFIRYARTLASRHQMIYLFVLALESSYVAGCGNDRGAIDDECMSVQGSDYLLPPGERRRIVYSRRNWL